MKAEDKAELDAALETASMQFAYQQRINELQACIGALVAVADSSEADCPWLTVDVANRLSQRCIPCGEAELTVLKDTIKEVCLGLVG